MASVKVYPLRNRASSERTRLTQSKIVFPCRKRTRETESKVQPPFSGNENTPLVNAPSTKRAKRGPAATPCHTTLPCDSDPTHIMPVTRSSARKSSKRRIGFAVGENDGQKEDVAGEDKLREILFSPSKTPGNRRVKSRGRLPLRPQNTKVAGGREGEGGKEEEEWGVTPTKVGVRKCERQATPSPVKAIPRNSAVSKQLDFSRCSAVHEAKRALHSSLPPTLLCRDQQLATLTDYLQSRVTHRKSGALYISGAPGTGKTACLSHILQNSKDLLTGVRVVTVNCMNVSSPQAVFSRLGEELLGGRRGPKGKNVEEALLKAITTSKKMTLVVLDEVDQLDSRSQEVLYTLFEWPAVSGSKLILIGIANSLDLTDRILPRLQSHVSCRPELLHFPPYSRGEIATILEERLRVKGETVVEPMAIQFCARKVAAVHGDLRKALDICRRAIELVETQNRRQGSKPSSDTNGDTTCAPVRVTLRHIASVISDVYSSGVTPSDQDAFPLQQKLIVCTLLLMVRGKTVKEVTLGKLHEAYVKVCRMRQLKFECESEFVSLCSMLETRGIVAMRRGKEARLTRVGMKLQVSDVEHALQDKVLISSILECGIPGN